RPGVGRGGPPRRGRRPLQAHCRAGGRRGGSGGPGSGRRNLRTRRAHDGVALAMSHTVFSRRKLGLFAGAAVLFATGTAFGGTYLNRAVVLLTGALREANYLRARLSDRELAGMIHHLAEARLAAATT